MVHNINALIQNVLTNFHLIKTNKVSSILNVSISNTFIDKIKEINSIFGQAQIENILSILTHIIDKNKLERQEQLKKAHIIKCIKWCKKNNLPMYDIYA